MFSEPQTDSEPLILMRITTSQAGR